MKNRFAEKSNRFRWRTAIAWYIAILLYPFISQLIIIVAGQAADVLLLKMRFYEFAMPWLTAWSVFGAAIGIYQFQKNMSLSERHHMDVVHAQKELIDIQQKQLKSIELENCHSRHERYLQMISSDNETIRLQGIDSLCVLAREHKEYVIDICNTLCRILCSSGENVTKTEKQRAANCLFCTYRFVFENVEKHIDGGAIDGVSFIRATIKNSHFDGTTLTNCMFHKSDIQDSSFISATLSNVLFRTTSIKHAFVSNAAITNDTRFSQSELYDVDFSHSKFENVQFADCSIGNCEFFKSDIHNVGYQKIKFCNKCGFECGHINNMTLMFSKEKDLNDFIELLPDKYRNKLHIQGKIAHII